MIPRKEHEFAEILVDKLFLESFANEQSAYHANGDERPAEYSLDRLRNKLRYHIKNSLSPRQKEVLKYYLKGKTEREIARILGVTQQVVNIYKQRAIKKLHRAIAG